MRGVIGAGGRVWGPSLPQVNVGTLVHLLLLANRRRKTTDLRPEIAEPRPCLLTARPQVHPQRPRNVLYNVVTTRAQCMGPPQVIATAATGGVALIWSPQAMESPPQRMAPLEPGWECAMLKHGTAGLGRTWQI